MDTENFDKMTIKEIVDYVIETYHKPLVIFFEKASPLVNTIDEKYFDECEKIKYLKELYSQFSRELKKHMNKEDELIFPILKKYWDNISETDFNISEEQKNIINKTKMENDHYEFEHYFLSIVDILTNSNLNFKDIEEFQELKSEFLNLKENTKTHSFLENKYLYPKWVEIQKKLK